MTPIRKAILPVAGLGTRFLPATKAMPKEMLPVVDRPLIQHVVDEAREAGIEHLIFVTGRNKSVIEDHFDRQFELELTLTERRRKADLELLSRDLPGGKRASPASNCRSASATRCGARANWSGTSLSRSSCRTCWCSTTAAASPR
jgi:UTP--glucose-1-phosphate uridylyltransferase